MSKTRELTKAELKRLSEYIDENGGQEPVAVAWGVSATTISRTLTQATDPSGLLMKELKRAKIVLAD